MVTPIETNGINTVERILKDPGIASKTSGHKVLWWPPRSRRKWAMIRAMHQISNIEQIVLVVDQKMIRREDGKVFTKYDLARTSSLDVRRFNQFRKEAKRKLSVILRT